MGYGEKPKECGHGRDWKGSELEWAVTLTPNSAQTDFFSTSTLKHFTLQNPRRSQPCRTKGLDGTGWKSP